MTRLDQAGFEEAGLSPLLTIDEVIAWLRISKSTLYRAIRAGQLPAFKVLGVWRIDRRDIEAFIQERKSQQPRPSQRSLSHPTPTVIAEPEKEPQ